MVLKSQEDEIITSHFKMKLQNLQKLYDRIPRSVVYFLGGSLPSTALLHMKQLTLFSMITRLLLKCYTPRNDLTNRQIDESKNISYNIIIIDALIICCNDVKIHCVLVSQFGERGEQLIVSAMMAGEYLHL